MYNLSLRKSKELTQNKSSLNAYFDLKIAEVLAQCGDVDHAKRRRRPSDSRARALKSLIRLLRCLRDVCLGPFHTRHDVVPYMKAYSEKEKEIEGGH